MTVELETREVKIYDVPVSARVKIPRPEQVVLRFANRKTVDVGVLCFLEREAGGSGIDRPFRRKLGGRRVVLASKSPDRDRHVRRLIEWISSEVRNGLARGETVRCRCSRFVAFMGWADAMGWDRVLDGAIDARDTLQAYSAYLRERVMRKSISLNSAVAQQDHAVEALEKILDCEGLAQGLHLLRYAPSLTQSTSPPDDASQGKVLALCRALFDGYCAIALDGAPFPHSISVPEFLQFPNDQLWALPSHFWILRGRGEMLTRPSRPGGALVLPSGRIVNVAEADELLLNEPGASTGIRWLTTIVARNIDAENSDVKGPYRKRFARRAMSCFVVLFFAETGMSVAEAAELQWRDDFEVHADVQGFRTIKWRAGGRVNQFSLPVEAMPLFRRFLDVRRLLLGEKSSPLLFFKLGGAGKDVPSSFEELLLETPFAELKRVDPTIPIVKARQWRAAKSDWLLREVEDVGMAAVVLQNTEKTVRQSYAAGSGTTAAQEMASFFDALSHVVASTEEPDRRYTERAVGVCAEFGMPTPEGPAGSVQPDCAKPEGCLFCAHSRVHADEADTRKLLSCRIFLVRTSSLAGSEARARQMVLPLIERVDALVEEIAKFEPDLVGRVRHQVEEEGDMDEYWAGKLEMLTELGVLS